MLLEKYALHICIIHICQNISAFKKNEIFEVLNFQLIVWKNTICVNSVNKYLNAKRAHLS